MFARSLPNVNAGADGEGVVVNCPSGATAEEFLSLSLQRLRSLVVDLEAAQEDIAKEKAKLKEDEHKKEKEEEEEEEPTENGSSNGVDTGLHQEKMVIGLFHPSHHERSIAGTHIFGLCVACAYGHSVHDLTLHMTVSCWPALQSTRWWSVPRTCRSAYAFR
jgi:hypothetical protein